MDKLVTHPLQQDMALVEKYARSGPRYTSYPTAPQFVDQFPVDDYLADARGQQLGPLSLYVHIPFCRDICYYCACNKIVTREPGAAQRYLASLRKEIALQAQLHGTRRPVRQMHWGGGSPTYLDNAEITELMHDLASHFSLMDSGVREYSVELDPRTTAPGAIPLMKGLGFNRVSLGIQDFDPLVQKSINRVQPYKMVRKLVEEIRHYDYRSLSFDLIYGLPHQDSISMESTLQKVIELRPDRIACFNYAHLPDRFKSQRAIDRLTLPLASDKLQLQWQIAENLQAEGYVHIGLDHYVLPDDDLATAQREGKLQRNFQGYSLLLADDLVGMGVSSISQVGDYYVQNARDLKDYCSDLARGELPIHRGYRTSSEDRLRRHVIMSLICNLSLDLKSCQLPWGRSFWQHFEAEAGALRAMQADGLVTLAEDRISITERGRPFLRNVCMVFDQYLNPTEAGASTPRYSAVI